MDDLISRAWLLAEYDKRHKGPPGGARKLIEEAPSAHGTNLAEVGTDLISRQAAIDDIWTVSPLARLDRKWVDRWLRQLPSAQPTFDARDTQYNLPIGTDCISRQAAIDALAEDMPSAYTPDGSHPADEGIFMAQEIYADCIQTLKELPSAQPKMGKWIYHIDDLFPAESTMECNQCHAEQPLTCDDEFCPHCGAMMEK